MKPSILRVHDKGDRWVISDGEHELRAGTSASLKSVVRRWEEIHGRPPGGYVRVPGPLHKAAAEAFLANLRRQVPKSCRACGCTDDDCRQCVEATGQACSWVEGEDPPICSRCHHERQVLQRDNEACARIRATAEGGAR